MCVPWKNLGMKMLPSCAFPFLYLLEETWHWDFAGPPVPARIRQFVQNMLTTGYLLT
jgi:hypothetical protein